MGFPHAFHGEDLCLQLLVLMTPVYPSFGHMSPIKGGPENAGHDLIWLCPCWETTASPCRSTHKYSLVLFLQPLLISAEFPHCNKFLKNWHPSSLHRLYCANLQLLKWLWGGKTFPWYWAHASHLTLPLSSQGKCFPCADNECPLMGHHADKFTVTDGISKANYFLNTGNSKPFSRKYPALPNMAKLKKRFSQSLSKLPTFYCEVKLNTFITVITVQRNKRKNYSS